MVRQWIQKDRLRVDPYLNWRAQDTLLGRMPQAADEWCLVRIAPLGPDIKAAILAIEQGLKLGRMPDDPEDELSIVASDHERALLAELNKPSPGSKPDTSQLELFVYRPERLVYDNGAFRVSASFRILHAGPPIPSSKFSPQRQISAAPGFPKRTSGITSEVAIGIIDDGIAFANARFLTARGKTRFQRVWLQDIGEARSPGSVAVGSVLTNQDIDKAIAAYKGNEQDIYAALAGVRSDSPEHQPLAFRRSHGTFCLDVATGSDPATAPNDRPIFAVQLPADAVADASGVTVGNYILQGVRQLIAWADDFAIGVPLIINFSYGLLAGPKDGSHMLEQALKVLVEQRTKRGAKTILVLAAGNSYNSRTNAALDIAARSTGTLDWVIPPDDETSNFVEIWFDGPEALGDPSAISVKLTAPGGGDVGKVGLDSSRDAVMDQDGVRIAGMRVDAGLGACGKRTRVFLAVSRTGSHDAPVLAPQGAWLIEIVNGTDSPLSARLYCQRDNTPAGYPRRGRQARFSHSDAYRRDERTGSYTDPSASPLNPRDSLSAIATGAATIVVGAAAAMRRNSEFHPASYTSSGPSAGRSEPDFSAVADFGPGSRGILASSTFTGSVVAMNGTSVAAPQVVRYLADQIGVSAAVMANGNRRIVQPNLQTVTVIDPLERLRLGREFLAPNPKSMRNRFCPR